MDSTIYFEVLVLINILLGAVLCDYLVGHVARTAPEMPSCPQVPSPKLLLQVRKLGWQVVCRAAPSTIASSGLSSPAAATRSALDVVFRHARFHDRYLVLPTDQVPHPRRHFTV